MARMGKSITCRLVKVKKTDPNGFILFIPIEEYLEKPLGSLLFKINQRLSRLPDPNQHHKRQDVSEDPALSSFRPAADTGSLRPPRREYRGSAHGSRAARP